MIENSNAERELASVQDASVRASSARPGQTYEVRGQAEAYESLQDLVAVLRKRWKVIAYVTGAAILLAILACLVLSSQYESVSLLEVNKDSASPATGGSDSSSPQDDIKTEVETATNILQGDGIAYEVIQQLKLADVKPFSKIHESSEKGLPLDQAPKTREAYLKKFAKALKVATIPDSRLVQVTFRNPDPVISAKVANTLLDTYIADTLRRRVETTSTTSFWIAKEIESLKTRVRDSEQAVADYEHKTGLAGIDLQSSSQQGGGGVSMQGHNAVLDRLNALNEEKTTAEANRISSEAVYRLTQSEDPEVVLGLGSMNIVGGGSVLSQGGGLDLLRSLRSQEVALRGQYADISTKYGAKNPRMVELKSQIDVINAELQTEMTRIRKRAENDFHYSQSNEASIDAELKKQEVLANKYTDQAVQLQLLAQEAISNRALYQSLFSELSEARVSAGIHATRLDVVDRALPAGSAAFPKVPIFIAVALAGGLVLGVIAAFVLQSLDHTIRVVKDAETTVHLPVLSELPLTSAGISATGGTPLIAEPRSGFAEAFHFLCTATISVLDVNAKSRVLLVASPLQGDGKSTVAYNLAISLAQRGERVLLIDADMRDPHQHAYFGVNNQPGLSELLRQQGVRLTERLAAHRDLANLWLLASGTPPDLPAELFSAASFDRMLDEARSHFRWVVIDSPPTLPFTDATIIASKVDGVLAVVRAGVTSRDVLKMFANILARVNAPMLGLVLNGVIDESRRSMRYANETLVQKAVKHAS